MNGFSALDFSTLIAFVLPGFVAVFSLGYLSEWAKVLFTSVLSKDSSTGAAFIIALASVAMGMIVSAIRSLVLDWIQDITGVKRPDYSLGTLSDSGVLTAYKEAIQNTYRYSQASGNMMVSLVMLLVFKFVIGGANIWKSLAILICTENAR